MDKKNLLKSIWETSYSDLVKIGITFEKVFYKGWLDIPTQEAREEVMKVGHRHFDNLKSLTTDVGKRVYVERFDMHQAAYADNHNKDYMKENEVMFERTFYVNCSKEQLIALGNYMNEHGIEFMKMPDNIHQQAENLVRQSKERKAEEATKEGDGTIRP